LKFKVNQKDLYNGLNIVRQAVATSKTLPILTGVHIKAVSNNGLILKATDLELGIEYRIMADIEKEGSIVLPASQLLNIVRELPDEEIYFNLNTDKWQAEIKCLSSLFKINGYDPDEFPNLPEVNKNAEFNFPAVKLKNMIEKVIISTSSDETQPVLTGALFVIKPEEVRMISTNTYRLSYIEADMKTNIDKNVEVILPGSTLQELNSLLKEEGSAEIVIDENYVKFKFNGIVFISRLIEGEFPNYELVIPDEFNSEFYADLSRLYKAVKRASLIARLDANIIKLKAVNNMLEIDSIEGNSGYAHEEVKIEMNGNEQNINIDAGYLLDVLKVLDEEEVKFEMIGPLNPLVIKSEQDKFIYLIMPVRSQS